MTFNDPHARGRRAGWRRRLDHGRSPLFYQALFTTRSPMWKPDVLADVIATVEFVSRLHGNAGHPARGLVVKGDDERSGLHGMGRTVSPGRSGTTAQEVRSGGDPESGVSFCYLTNGIDEHELRQWRRARQSPTERGTASAEVSAFSPPVRCRTREDPACSWSSRWPASCSWPPPAPRAPWAPSTNNNTNPTPARPSP